MVTTTSSKSRTQRAYDLGGDKGKAPTGYEVPRDVDRDAQEDQAAPVGFGTIKEALSHLYNAIEHYGFRLAPSHSGRWCSHELFKKSQLAIPGLIQPKGFYRWQPVYPSDEAVRSSFFAAVREIARSQIENPDLPKPLKQCWNKVVNNFEDRLIDGKCDVSTAARGYAGETTPRSATLTGKSNHNKVVPPLEWFPKELQEYDVRKLLTLFPDAEATMLQLILGRLMAGANRTEVAEGLMLHTFRSMAIIVGSQAGLGKSTLLHYLSTTLDLLGYSKAEINSDFNKFGWGTIAQADLAMIDDLTDSTLKGLLGDARIKSITSNNNLKVEEKGIAAVDVRSVSVVLGCSNGTNYAHYIGVDSGVLSRLNQLDTFNEAEMQEFWGHDRCYKLKEFWEEEASRFGVSQETLMALLLRKSMDMFLEVAGLFFDDRGFLRKDSASDTLEQTIAHLRSCYRIDVSLKHAEELAQVASRLVALVIAERSKVPTLQAYLDAAKRIDFNPDLLLLVIRLFTISADLEGTAYEGLIPTQMSWDILPYLQPKINDYAHLKNNKSIEQAFEVVVKELKSSKGFMYPTKSSHYQPLWQAERRMIPSLVSSYKEALDNHHMPQSLDAIVMDATKLFHHVLRLK